MEFCQTEVISTYGSEIVGDTVGVHVGVHVGDDVGCVFFNCTMQTESQYAHATI